MTDVAAPLYTAFARYPLPRELAICEQCGPQWSIDDIRSTPLRSLSLPQLEALHVMSLSDDHFRHFFPRLIELLADEKAPVFAFNLRGLRQRIPRWPTTEKEAVGQLVDDLWRRLLAHHPAEIGYFSDGPTLIDFTYWTDQPLQPHLDRWSATGTVAAAQHLGELVEAAFTTREPFDPAVKEQVLTWLRQPTIGECLGAANLDAAEELWRVCGR
ncbi:hypothetical protein FHT40_004745 [Mycolicibacterium sp. BK556]|uniref:hypothetical protein n=1 Tax=unclassified Mycolicibacterium TaxID=2636767 RepID=UPI00161413E6|nr:MULTISPECIES: hypothetical protein [unclassified Mycolicibacterium]MBB3605061.1 hypothetical protein [Mycolicibacterium sp. BK556]MBB3635257.1 hypothetical protein [Mycolicibacterium sp. BK607]